jgi:hypothetical protein
MGLRYHYASPLGDTIKIINQLICEIQQTSLNIALIAKVAIKSLMSQQL